ncbi:MAG: hypothetical protein OXG62_16845, partial [Nitrospinae bacterium]|nr:hypothetical protein [Nitrospinota bacterium]
MNEFVAHPAFDELAIYHAHEIGGIEGSARLIEQIEGFGVQLFERLSANVPISPKKKKTSHSQNEQRTSHRQKTAGAALHIPPLDHTLVFQLFQP